MVGASLAAVGVALQALFRNSLAEPMTLGVSGGGALGASLAIAFSAGARLFGVPIVFIAAFAGAGAAMLVVYRLARTGAVVMPGALLLAGVVINFIAPRSFHRPVLHRLLAPCNPAVDHRQLDVVGFDLLGAWRVLVPAGWRCCCRRATHARPRRGDGGEPRRQRPPQRARSYVAASMIVGVTVAVGAPSASSASSSRTRSAALRRGRARRHALLVCSARPS